MSSLSYKYQAHGIPARKTLKLQVTHPDTRLVFTTKRINNLAIFDLSLPTVPLKFSLDNEYFAIAQIGDPRISFLDSLDKPTAIYLILMTQDPLPQPKITQKRRSFLDYFRPQQKPSIDSEIALQRCQPDAERDSNFSPESTMNRYIPPTSQSAIESKSRRSYKSSETAQQRQRILFGSESKLKKKGVSKVEQKEEVKLDYSAAADDLLNLEIQHQKEEEIEESSEGFALSLHEKTLMEEEDQNVFSASSDLLEEEEEENEPKCPEECFDDLDEEITGSAWGMGDPDPDDQGFPF